MNNSELGRANTKDQSLKEKLSSIIGQNSKPSSSSVIKPSKKAIIKIIPLISTK